MRDFALEAGRFTVLAVPSWGTYTVVEADRPLLSEEYPTVVFVSSDLGAIVVTHEATTSASR